MALKLRSLREAGTGMQPVERLLAAYNVVMAAVWATLLGRMPEASLFLAAHAAGAALAPAVGALRLRFAGRGAPALELYPLVLIAMFWSELNRLRYPLHAASNDALIQRLDLSVFGLHLQAVWMPAMPQVWVSELMHLVYFLYYPLIAVPSIALALQRRTGALREAVLRLMVTYLACFVVYAAFPVDGPSCFVPRYQGAHTAGLFYGLVHGAIALGDSRGTAFPSSHVAGAVTAACIGWLFFRRRVAWALIVQAAGVVASTVYTQNHYAIDSLAGVAFALALQAVVVPLARRRLARAPSLCAAPAEALPVTS